MPELIYQQIVFCISLEVEIIFGQLNLNQDFCQLFRGLKEVATRIVPDADLHELNIVVTPLEKVFVRICRHEAIFMKLIFNGPQNYLLSRLFFQMPLLFSVRLRWMVSQLVDLLPLDWIYDGRQLFTVMEIEFAIYANLVTQIIIFLDMDLIYFISNQWPLFLIFDLLPLLSHTTWLPNPFRSLNNRI